MLGGRRTRAPRPPVEFVVGDLAHHGLVRAHPVAVERRQHHLAPRQVLGALEQQQRPRADQRLSVICRPGGIVCPRSPYSARITSGLETITSGVWKPWNVTLNVSPYARRQSSRNRIGRATHRAVCTAGDSVGPGIAVTRTDRTGARVRSTRCAQARCSCWRRPSSPGVSPATTHAEPAPTSRAVATATPTPTPTPTPERAERVRLREYRVVRGRAPARRRARAGRHRLVHGAGRGGDGPARPAHRASRGASHSAPARRRTA